MNENQTEKIVNRNKWRYHPALAPEGKQFSPDELEALDGSWVDTPAKFIADKEPEPAVEVPSASETTTLDNEPEAIEEKQAPVTSEAGEEIAEILLKTEGLNHSSFMRGLGKDPRKPGDRKETADEYAAILTGYASKIYKQGNDWFLLQPE